MNSKGRSGIALERPFLSLKSIENVLILQNGTVRNPRRFL